MLSLKNSGIVFRGSEQGFMSQLGSRLLPNVVHAIRTDHDQTNSSRICHGQML